MHRRPLPVLASIRVAAVLRRVVLVAVLVGVGLAVDAPAAHADPFLCRRAIVGATARFAQAKMKALQKCEDGVVARRNGLCPDGKAGAKIAKAGYKLRRAIGKACGGLDANCGTGSDDDALVDIGWDLGTCPNIASGSCETRSSIAAT